MRSEYKHEVNKIKETSYKKIPSDLIYGTKTEQFPQNLSMLVRCKFRFEKLSLCMAVLFINWPTSKPLS